MTGTMSWPPGRHGQDFEYELEFDTPAGMLEQEAVLLRFEGIDTVADLELNGMALGHVENMHRTWEFPVKDALREKENRLRVCLRSPTGTSARPNEKNPLLGTADAMEGFPHLRKAHCMFGWDWGPRLPDAGHLAGGEPDGLFRRPAGQCVYHPGAWRGRGHPALPGAGRPAGGGKPAGLERGPDSGVVLPGGSDRPGGRTVGGRRTGLIPFRHRHSDAQAVVAQRPMGTSLCTGRRWNCCQMGL